MRRKKIVLIATSLCLISAAEPNRNPDIKSERAKLEDYYVYDSQTGKWIWSEYYDKLKTKIKAKIKSFEGQVIQEETTITTTTEESAPPAPTPSQPVPEANTESSKEDQSDDEIRQQILNEKEEEPTPTPTSKAEEPYSVENKNVAPYSVENIKAEKKTKEVGLFRKFLQNVIKTILNIIFSICEFFISILNKLEDKD